MSRRKKQTINFTEKDFSFGSTVETDDILEYLWNSLEYTEAYLRKSIEECGKDAKNAEFFILVGKCIQLKSAIYIVLNFAKIEITEAGKEYLKNQADIFNYRFLPKEDFGIYDHRDEIVWNEEKQKFSYPKSKSERLFESIFGKEMDDESLKKLKKNFNKRIKGKEETEK